MTHRCAAMLRRNIGFSQTVSARALIIRPPFQPGMPQVCRSATTLPPLAISTGAGGGRHHVAKAEILRPISAAAADILQNTPQVGILRFCELVTPAHGYPSSICSLSL